MSNRYCQILVAGLLFCAWPAESQTDAPRSGAFYYHQSLDKSVPIQQAIQAGWLALDSFSSMRNDSLVNLARIQLGILYWHDGQFDSARSHLDEGQKISSRRQDGMNYAKCIHYKALVSYYRCEFDTALVFYEQAALGYRKVKNDSAEAKVKYHKSLIYLAKGNYPDAIRNMMESFHLQETMPGNRDMTLSMPMPNLAAQQLFYESKLVKDLESLRFLETKSDLGSISFTLFNIGKDYAYLRRYAEAIPYLLRCNQIDRMLGRLPYTGDLALAYVGVGNYDSAEYWYRSRLRDLVTKGTQIHLSALYSDMGAFYSKQNKWPEALGYYDLSFDLNQKLGLPRSLAIAAKSKALVLQQLHRNAEALAEIEISLGIAKRIQLISDIKDFLEIKSTILQELNRDKEAIEALRQSVVLRDSIFKGENQMQLARLQIEYETDKKNRALEESQSQNRLKESQIESRNLQIALALSLVALVTFGGGFYYYRYRQNRKFSNLLTLKNQLIEKQNEDLQLQNKEKEVLLHEIHHRVKNNLQIISSLIHLKARQTISVEANEALQQINGRIFSMGLLHEKLYQKEDIRSIQLDEYLKEISQQLVSSFDEAGHPISLSVNCQPVEIDVSRALTCGLIVNELLTNAIKYAFTTDQNDRKITLSLRQNNITVFLNISDNGMSPKPISGDFKKSFGSRFVDQLVMTKLGGEWSAKVENGLHLRIEFMSMNGTGKDQDSHR